MKRKLVHQTVFVLAILGSLVLLNVIALRAFGRFDMTSDKRYTLSKASKQTMEQLDDAITVTAYFTQELPPPYSSNARYLRDLLAEYRAASKGKLSFEFIDPREKETVEDKETKKEIKRDIFGRSFRDATSIERELMASGIQPVEVPHVEEDKQQFMRAYMALVVKHQEKKEVIPVVRTTEGLEYHLTSMIRRMTRQKQPVLAVLQGHDAPKLEEKLTQLQAALAQTYSVRPIDLSGKDKIDDDVDSLWVVGPKTALQPNEIRAIDQFLMRGKSAAFLLDAVQVDPRSFQPSDADHGLAALLKTYGVEVGDQLVGDVQSGAINLQERRGYMLVTQQVPFAFLPVIQRMEGDSAISSGLGGITLPFVTPVKASGGDGRSAAVLARSSAKSWLEARPFNIDPRREWHPESLTGPHDLMVQVSGRLRSHLTGDANTSQPGGTPLAAGQGDAHIVVAGGSSWVWDDYAHRNNLVLAANIADWLALDPALLAVRSRGVGGTPLKAEISDGARNGVKFGNALGVPILLVGFGLVRWRMRESRRSKVSV
jgi:gliding-associated putative ABC transporter substrate-binding component GldG